MIINHAIKSCICCFSRDKLSGEFKLINIMYLILYESDSLIAWISCSYDMYNGTTGVPMLYTCISHTPSDRFPAGSRGPSARIRFWWLFHLLFQFVCFLQSKQGKYKSIIKLITLIKSK